MTDEDLMSTFLQQAKLQHLASTLAKRSLESLGATLVESGRVRLLQELKDLGIQVLKDRQAVANGLTRAIRDGLLSKKGSTPIDFEVQAQRMPPIVRKLLIDSTEPSSVPLKELLSSLSIAKVNAEFSGAVAADVMRVPGTIDAEGCMKLRRAVDSERSTVLFM